MARQDHRRCLYAQRQRWHRQTAFRTECPFLTKPDHNGPFFDAALLKQLDTIRKKQNSTDAAPGRLSDFNGSFVGIGLLSQSEHMKRILFGCLAVALICSGCAWFGAKEEKPSQELARDGMEFYQKGKYDKAIESFEKLKDWYPFSKFAILAELKIADAYFQLKQYEDAIFAYEGFERLHPRNEAIPYVIYRIGLSNFNQIDTIDRDQTATRKALETFGRLVQQFPGDNYAVKADAHMKKCLKTLAGHEFYVGLFYYKGKHYKAALHRFKSVLSHFPDVGVHYQALQYIASCEASLNKTQSEK